MDNFKTVFGNPVPATLCEDITYLDIHGARRKWNKGSMVRVYVIPANSAYGTGKAFEGHTRADNYLAVCGQDSVSITNQQFKAID